MLQVLLDMGRSDVAEGSAPGALHRTGGRLEAVGVASTPLTCDIDYLVLGSVGLWCVTRLLVITEMNGTQLVPFGTRDRTLGPHWAATHRIQFQ
jgi:hypothetical protein